MEIKLNVKDKSVVAFLEERLVGYKPNERREMQGMHDVSGYNLLRDEMYFKKYCDVSAGDLVKIELFDETKMSQKRLVNTYIYVAKPYDDVAIKLTLNDFKVDLKGEEE